MCTDGLAVRSVTYIFPAVFVFLPNSPALFFGSSETQDGNESEPLRGPEPNAGFAPRPPASRGFVFFLIRVHFRVLRVDRTRLPNHHLLKPMFSTREAVWGRARPPLGPPGPPDGTGLRGDAARSRWSVSCRGGGGFPLPPVPAVGSRGDSIPKRKAY